VLRERTASNGAILDNASHELLRPSSSGTREYDPEIKDMASYIHNYEIDSDLAVRF
jgi:2-methylcitrate dehydratase